MTKFSATKKFSKIRVSWIPIFASFAFATVEYSTSKDASSSKFLLTNIFGFTLSLTIEIHKRWASESRMAHFAEYLPTSAPIFSDLMALIERIDKAYERIGEETLVERIIGMNPIETGLRQAIWEASSQIQSLSDGLVITPHYDNRLSITLSENVDLVRGISIAETDVPFWKSEQGHKYLSTQETISLKNQNSNYTKDTRSGVYRIFCLDGNSDKEVREMIVQQVRSGVKVALFKDEYNRDLAQDELGIFGDLCVRKTKFSSSRSKDSVNQYSFAKGDVERAVTYFHILWNQSVLVTAEDFRVFSLAELEEFF